MHLRVSLKILLNIVALGIVSYQLTFSGWKMTILIVDGIFVVGFSVMTYDICINQSIWTLARYMMVFIQQKKKKGSWWYSNLQTLWFYLYVNCQTLAYIIELAGWAIGIKLGNQTSSVEYSGHVTIGIFLFVLGTLLSTHNFSNSITKLFYIFPMKFDLYFV